ncbi:MAG TPA: hypothetical protein VFE54_12710 [Mucilaginibacter sp.]|nr:hypothetical protein [Mucilaginibacter sp.]
MDKLEFEFDNKAGELVSSLDYMLDHIKGCLPVHVETEDVLFKCKVIITELLTNAIKHPGKGKTLFNIELNETALVISKTDYGLPLYLINTRNNSARAIAETNKRLISADPLTSLYANWESENHIRFSSEEGSLDNFLSVEQVMEHFGMLIITNSSDEFTYVYHKNTRANVFNVKILF